MIHYNSYLEKNIDMKLCFLWFTIFFMLHAQNVTPLSCHAVVMSMPRHYFFFFFFRETDRIFKFFAHYIYKNNNSDSEALGDLMWVPRIGRGNDVAAARHSVHPAFCISAPNKVNTRPVNFIWNTLE
jgi:hypothetical protein